uniref:Protein kinase domain-containing protein n=1 Tax=Romanomermis culicivorax TaxID=13658 RepID=A0A915KQI7_ROMCU
MLERQFMNEKFLELHYVYSSMSVHQQRSTIGNIKLINKFREGTSPKSPEAFSDYKQFIFWIDFFVEMSKNHEGIAGGLGEKSDDTRFPILIAEPNKTYSPSYTLVNLEEKSLSIWNVITAPSGPNKLNVHQWRFPVDAIKAVSASKRDDRAVFLYVYQNSDDFMLFFPSDGHRGRFLHLMEDITSNNDGSKLIFDYERIQTVNYEYEYDSLGNKVILGKGTFGKVFAGRDVTSQRAIAIKEVEIKNSEEIQPLMEEIQLHSTLSHKNIVQYLGCEVSEDGRTFKIFMEQVPGGSLSSLLRSKWGPLIDNESTIIYYARQILEGLNYLARRSRKLFECLCKYFLRPYFQHAQRIAHRDIKGDNVLVNTYSGLCKISDFGTCKRLAGLNPVTDTFTGTLQYMAPEVIDQGQRGYGAPADIWSFGCTMIEMATGKPPFVELGSPQAAMFKVGMFKMHPPIPEELSDEAKVFILRCFEPDSTKRPTCAELLQDPFLESLRRRQETGARKIENKIKKTIKDAFKRSTSYISGNTITTSADSNSNNNDYEYDFETIAEEPAEADSKIPASSHMPLLTSSTTPSQKTAALLLSAPTSNNASPTPVDIRVSSNSNELSPGVPASGDHSNRFFLLRKDSERRETLVAIMTDFDKEIIESWLAAIRKDILKPVLSENLLTPLLAALREHIHSRDYSIVQKALDKIRSDLDYDATSVGQLHLALFMLQDAVIFLQMYYRAYDVDDSYLVLKQQQIKPHWMFALDNLIRSAVQCAVNVLSPDLGANMTSAENADSASASQYSTVESRKSQNVSAGPASLNLKMTREPVFSISNNNTHVFNELKDLIDQNKRLLDELINVNRRYQELLKCSIQDKNGVCQFLTEMSRHSYADSGAYVNFHSPATCGPSTSSIYSTLSRLNSTSSVKDVHLAKWLREREFDEQIIRKIVCEEEFTKEDFLEYVSSREELLRIGLNTSVVLSFLARKSIIKLG